MDQYGAAPQPAYIQDMANLLLEHDSADIQPVGKN